MRAQVAAFVSGWRPFARWQAVAQWQAVAGRIARRAHRDLAGRGVVLLAVFSLVLAIAVGPASEPPSPSVWEQLGLAADGPALRRVQAGEAGDLEQVFSAHDYGPAVLLADDGLGVPRLAVTALPRDMAEIEDSEARKALFLRTLLPLVLQANRELRLLRAKVTAALDARAEGRLSATDALWLEALEQWYGAEEGNAADLLTRVDSVPPSLVLAQAAQESGWGTSRFALRANALFGQRAWGERAVGLVPTEAKRRDFKVRAFPDLQSAVRAYLHNLNSHSAYRDLRERRARARAMGVAPHALEMVHGLTSYSEEGADYVAALSELIRSNELQALDELRLRERRLP
ncbi:MAG: glucosaminidase domain-containing protein [Kiloniellaceae bacterium]